MSQPVHATAILQNAYVKLDDLRNHLSKDIVEDKEIQHVIDFLHKESASLARYLSHAGSIKEKISPIDPKLHTDFLTLINSISHSPACNQALGSLQLEFSNTLKRFVQVVHKWESRVEKVNQEPL